jgi:hypothetical protein
VIEINKLSVAQYNMIETNINWPTHLDYNYL